MVPYSIKKGDEMLPVKVTRVAPGVYQLGVRRPSSHSYLITGRHKNLLIDSGLDTNFPALQAAIRQVGIKTSSIDLVINTHEHFDHIGGNKYLSSTSLIAASRFAAAKIMQEDEYVTMFKQGQVEKSVVPHLWLENDTVIELGDFRLQVIYTPGHTSGCICIYEPDKKMLFSGDTVFAEGTLSAIAPSGSAGDYVDSLKRLAGLRVDLLLPGHGSLSTNFWRDHEPAILLAKERLQMAKSKGGSDTWSESTPLSFDETLV